MHHPACGVANRLYQLAKPILFRFDPESIHDRSHASLVRLSGDRRALRALSVLAPGIDPRLRMLAFGTEFDFPFGIAAGLDKAGQAFPALTALGFGFVEIGTVTFRPQSGNPRPRIFRVPDQEALINCMGFPGPGVDAVRKSLAMNEHLDGILAASIGPNRDAVDIGNAVQQCTHVYRELAPFVRFAVLNPSSPNTPGLRNLLKKPDIGTLMNALQQTRSECGGPPIAVKISPDLSDAEIYDIVEASIESGTEGIVATNTTSNLPSHLAHWHRCPAGGLSGRPLAPAASHVVERVSSMSEDKLTVIAVGGIFTGADVVVAVTKGATLVQTYTGFIYRGPAMAASLAAEIGQELDRLGAATLMELRGQGTGGFTITPNTAPQH